MVCAKCQKKLQKTELATPGVKRKSDMYYGSPSSTLGAGGDAKSKPTLGNTGVSKVSRLLFIYIFHLFCLSCLVWVFWVICLFFSMFLFYCLYMI